MNEVPSPAVNDPAAAPARGPGRGPGRPPSRTLRKRRRDEILDAATVAFARHGYAGTDLEVVAREIGCAKGTLYRYFPSKRELFFAAVDRGMWALREALDTCFSVTPEPDAATGIAQVENAVRTYLNFFQEHGDLVELLMVERAEFRDRETPSYFVHREAAIQPWHRLVERLVALGVFRDVSPEGVTDLVSNLLYGTLFTNHFRKPPSDVDRQVDEIKELLLRGLLADDARSGGPS